MSTDAFDATVRDAFTKALADTVAQKVLAQVMEDPRIRFEIEDRSRRIHRRLRDRILYGTSGVRLGL